MSHTMYATISTIVHIKKELILILLHRQIKNLNVSIRTLKERKIGRQYFCKHIEMNCFPPKKMPKAQIIKEKVDFLF